MFLFPDSTFPSATPPRRRSLCGHWSVSSTTPAEVQAPLYCPGPCPKVERNLRLQPLNRISNSSRPRLQKRNLTRQRPGSWRIGRGGRRLGQNGVNKRQSSDRRQHQKTDERLRMGTHSDLQTVLWATLLGRVKKAASREYQTSRLPFQTCMPLQQICSLREPRVTLKASALLGARIYEAARRTSIATNIASD